MKIVYIKSRSFFYAEDRIDLKRKTILFSSCPKCQSDKLLPKGWHFKEKPLKPKRVESHCLKCEFKMTELMRREKGGEWEDEKETWERLLERWDGKRIIVVLSGLRFYVKFKVVRRIKEVIEKIKLKSKG